MTRTIIRFSRDGHLAVEPPTFAKIEAKLEGGLARVAQRTDVTRVRAVMDYPKWNVHAGDVIILAGDSGLQPWAKLSYEMGSIGKFVLVPEQAIIGVEQLV